jgi:hypothetical protein
MEKANKNNQNSDKKEKNTRNEKIDCHLVPYPASGPVSCPPVPESPIIVEKKIKCFEDTLQLKLTDSFTPARIGDFTQGPVNISKNGDKVFVGTLAFDATASDPVAILYSNAAGKLVEIGRILDDPDFPNAESVAASADFTRFIVAEDNGVDTGRLRLFSFSGGSFQLLATKALSSSFLAETGAMNFGTFAFSADTKYVAISYLNNNEGGVGTSRLEIYDANNLNLITFIDGQPGFPNTGANFFDLTDKHGKKHHYLVGTYVKSTIDEFFDITFSAPATLIVYEFKDTDIRVIDSTLLPQLPLSAVPFIYNPKADSTLIIATTGIALLPGQPSFYDITQFSTPPFTFIPGDNNNLRIFKFDGSKLKLVYKESIDASNIFTPAWYPTEEFVTWAQTAGNLRVNIPTNPLDPTEVVRIRNDSNAIVTRRLETDKKCLLDLRCGSKQTPSGPPGSTIAVFSENGKWLVASGTFESTSMNTLGLFKVKVIKEELGKEVKQDICKKH